MILRLISVEALRPAPYNPRITLKPGDAAWRKIERSLKEFNLIQPIVWNERTGHVVSGHQRLAVLKSHGTTAVDCVVVDLPLEKEKALNVTLNNSTVASDWDPDRLLDLITDLQTLPDFDATLTGFDEQELKDLLLSPAIIAVDAERDASQEHEGREVTLEIPEQDWESARQALDDMLSDLPGIRLHVKQSSF